MAKRYYQESGVKEYWIIETEERMVLVYTLQNDIYIGLKPFTEGEVIQSIVFSELKIQVDDLFKRVK